MPSAFSALTVFALAAAVSYDVTTGAGSSLVMPRDEYIVASQNSHSLLLL